VERFLGGNKIIFFVHSTTNFFATSMLKKYLRILTIYSMHLIGHHVPWFKFQILEKMRWDRLHVLRLRSPCSIHCSHVNYTTQLVESIMLVMSGEMFISRTGFYAVTKLFFIHQTTNFYATSALKTFLRILTFDYMHPIDHHVPWFKFQIYEFYFF
jgi:hypothetical protein